jgi:hypothetical protein
MLKILRLPLAAPVIAIAVLILSACLLAYDVELWNKTCGAEVRTYDVWTEVADLDWGPPPLLFPIIAFLVLTIPAALVRSRAARVATTISLLLPLVGVFLYASDNSRLSYVDYCYTGGHENGPGQGMLLVALPGILVSIFNAGILAVDWIVWLAQVFIHRHREFS